MKRAKYISEGCVLSRTFDIDELCGGAYQAAIENVIKVLNSELPGAMLTFRDSMDVVDSIAARLNLRFDVDGEIV